MRIELADTTNTLLKEIALPKMNTVKLALTYAMAIRSSWPTDWAKVNRAIVLRWNKAVLTRVKTRAWKLIKER